MSPHQTPGFRACQNYTQGLGFLFPLPVGVFCRDLILWRVVCLHLVDALDWHTHTNAYTHMHTQHTFMYAYMCPYITVL